MPRSAWLIPLVALIVFIADFASKMLALSSLQPGVLQPLVPPFLGMTLVHNTGAAFGMWRSQKLMVTILPPLICLVMIYWITQRERKGDQLKAAEQVGFGMLLGGAAGNIFDRLTRGEVTDFLYFPFYPEFPVFNVADALIDAGVVLILLHAMFTKSPTPEQRQTENADGDIHA